MFILLLTLIMQAEPPISYAHRPVGYYAYLNKKIPVGKQDLVITKPLDNYGTAIIEASFLSHDGKWTKPLPCLIDTGTYQTYLNPQFAETLGLPVLETNLFRAKTANVGLTEHKTVKAVFDVCGIRFEEQICGIEQSGVLPEYFAILGTEFLENFDFRYYGSKRKFTLKFIGQVVQKVGNSSRTKQRR